MRFVISSTEILNRLQAVSKVISQKNTLPILDNFLFDIKGDELTITSSDLETTLITKQELENVDGEGRIAIEAKRLTDILKEFPEQPLTFEIDEEKMQVDILSENGKFSIPAIPDDGDFPEPAGLEEDKTTTFEIKSRSLQKGINKTIFATSDDELRPVMNGIFIELREEEMIFVASDSHKLVRYKRLEVKSEKEASFILPKKPADLMKNILSKKEEEMVTVSFDEKNAVFKFSDYKLICRLIEGDYPNYESVIPFDNPNKLSVDRTDFYNTIKRVAVFSNEASRLVKFELKPNQITVSAQDIDFSISAFERITCQFEGEDMKIGFKSSFFQDILYNLSADDIIIEMSDPAKAAIILPLTKEDEYEEELMLIMPMRIEDY